MSELSNIQIAEKLIGLSTKDGVLEPEVSIDVDGVSYEVTHVMNANSTFSVHLKVSGSIGSGAEDTVTSDSWGTYLLKKKLPDFDKGVFRTKVYTPKKMSVVSNARELSEIYSSYSTSVFNVYIGLLKKKFSE